MDLTALLLSRIQFAFTITFHIIFPSFTIGLTASVAVGIHLTVCWVVDVDFDGYWQFHQDITTPSIPIPLV